MSVFGNNDTLPGSSANSGLLTDGTGRSGAVIQAFILLVVGVFGNILVIVVFARRIRRIRSSVQGYVYNYMVFALAIGDLSVLLVQVSFYLARPYILDDILCKVWVFFGNACLHYVHFLICFGIPLERYIAVCKPLFKLSRNQVSGIIGIAGIGSIVGGAVSAFAYGIELIGDNRTCQFRQNSFYSKTLVPASQFITAIVGVVLTMILYAIVFKKLLELKKQSARDRLHSNRRNVTGFEAVRANFRVALMLFGVMVIYLLSCMPHFLCMLNVVPYDNRLEMVFFINSASNFIMYGAINAKLRQEMICTLTCRKQPITSRRSSQPSMISRSRSSGSGGMSNQKGSEYS